MGRFIPPPGVTPGTDRPKVDVLDPLLPEQGALWLVDLEHPSVPFSGALENAATLPNLAYQQAMALLGATDRAKVDLRIGMDPAGFTGGKGLIERTAKGGIHVAPSPTLVDATTRFQISPPWQALDSSMLMREFLRTTTHEIYMSVWARTTRAATQTAGNTPDVAEIGSTSAISANRRLQLASTGYQYPLSQGRAPSTVNNAGPAVGPHHYSNYSSAWGGTVPGAASGMVVNAFAAVAGSPYAYTDALRRNREAIIVYRMYAEDLTVSGRTYAQVDAIDNALYTAAFTVGGRYYGDTFTDPATIP